MVGASGQTIFGPNIVVPAWLAACPATWLKARCGKRPSANQLRLSAHWLSGLLDLKLTLHAGTSQPLRTASCAVEHLKTRENHPPDFAGRLVQRLLVDLLQLFVCQFNGLARSRRLRCALLALHTWLNSQLDADAQVNVHPRWVLGWAPWRARLKHCAASGPTYCASCNVSTSGCSLHWAPSASLRHGAVEAIAKPYTPDSAVAPLQRRVVVVRFVPGTGAAAAPPV